jgi:phosphoribosyl 1,2-cyclic phosphodiesterase
MRVKFWGVRGSIPAPGPETNRYGGNTSCVSVRTAQDELVIIDMGTGATNLGGSLLPTEFGKGAGSASVLLSHAHWDHIQGFPFFPPVFIPGNKFVLYGNAKSSSMLEGILEGQMNPHFSPIYTLKNLGSTISLVAVPLDKTFEASGLTISAVANPHGSTTALAFRLEEAGRSFVYASDTGYPADTGPSDAAIELYRDADVLLHDCTYTVADQETRRNRGFSSVAEAATAATKAGVKHLVMFHYDQDYSDDDVDALKAECRAELDSRGGESIQLTAAAEGLELEI